MTTVLPPWSVVTVPFPYVEREHRKVRPALVLCTGDFQEATGLCWVLMITSAVHDTWPGDVPIDDLRRAGLSKPSVIRTAKIAIAEVHRLAAIGDVAPDVRTRVRSVVLNSLASDVPPP